MSSAAPSARSAPTAKALGPVGTLALILARTADPWHWDWTGDIP
ncbi:hypothetical protein GCM10010260_83800 [Streptomyces filipinensis]|uniref:Uncharacterized protein n=1 Tax=Streptomyces filipinensis TaxID=66887 RepID=A0A918MFB7_9ACTN|nr:hypothetical protein [Streptomyces filipinensis]GGV30523.1 hypothetical protein GCM10010260_83800 [Streptomyces filipinensis]